MEDSQTIESLLTSVEDFVVVRSVQLTKERKVVVSLFTVTVVELHHLWYNFS